MSSSNRESHILCCKCGVSMVPNEASTCVACLSTEVDITVHIERQNTVVFCSKCERYLVPPSKWVSAAPESPELLALCIKRVRGLNKGLRVKGAKFIWTEPHSRRINIEVTVRGELPTGDMVEQEIPLEFIVHTQQCPDCTRTAAKDYWNACVQVRQRVDHKRTLLALEQTILHSQAHGDCHNIKQVSDGIDFYFNTRSQAVNFVNFLCKHAPCKYQTSQHLKSHDCHNNTYNYKFTFSVEVSPICKNDIVCLSKPQSQRLGGIGPICVVKKVSDCIHLINPVTCQVARINAASYFASPFTAIASQKQLVEFVVIEIEDDDIENAPKSMRVSKRHRPVSLWLMRLNSQAAADPSSHTPLDVTVHTRSHLGHILQDGDTVLGLDLRNCNINHTQFDQLSDDEKPDVILVHRPVQSADNDGLSCTNSLPNKRRRKNSLAGFASDDISVTNTDAAMFEDNDVDVSDPEVGHEGCDNNVELEDLDTEAEMDLYEDNDIEEYEVDDVDEYESCSEETA